MSEILVQVLAELPLELIGGMLIPITCFYYSWWCMNKLHQKDYPFFKKVGLLSVFPLVSAIIICVDYYLNWEELFLFSWFISLAGSLAILTRKEVRGKSIKEIFQLKSR